jgi:beta-glucosidase/6-phospho-beta-glucosidase/beta-galactosidase
MLIVVIGICTIIFFSVVTEWVPPPSVRPSIQEVRAARATRVAAAVAAAPVTPATCVPPSFTFGVATSAYQIEGGVQEGGRGPSGWDAFAYLPGKIGDGSNGDIASDSYHRWRDDIAALQALNASSYRFSLSWSRIMRSDGGVNEEGLRYYRTLIRALLRARIEPQVTIYHWDTPLWFEDPENFAPLANMNATTPALKQKKEWLLAAMAPNRTTFAEHMARAEREESTEVGDMLRRITAAMLPSPSANNNDSSGSGDSGGSNATAAVVDSAALNSPTLVRGWLDARIVPLFARFAQVAYKHFGQYIRQWSTINEPGTVCYVGYRFGTHAPGRCSDRNRCTHGDGVKEPWLCQHYMILAHAYAKLLYDQLYRSAAPGPGFVSAFTPLSAAAVAARGSNGTHASSDATEDDGSLDAALQDNSWRRGVHGVSYTIGIDMHIPLSLGDAVHTRSATNPLPIITREHIALAPKSEQQAAHRAIEFNVASWFDPLYWGDYPRSVRLLLGDTLPRFTPQQQRDMLSAPLDYIAINHYSSRYASQDPACLNAPPGQPPAGPHDETCVTRTEWDTRGRQIGPVADSKWLLSFPSGLPLVLDWITRRYSSVHAQMHARPRSRTDGNRGGSGEADRESRRSGIEWPERSVEWAFNTYHHSMGPAHSNSSSSSSSNVNSGGNSSTRRRADNVPLIINENGASEPGSGAPNVTPQMQLVDPFRTSFYQNYTFALFDGVRRYNLNVHAYHAWSLVDNFEWADGMNVRFGVHYLEPKTLKRVPRESARFLAEAFTDPGARWGVCQPEPDAGHAATAAGTGEGTSAQPRPAERTNPVSPPESAPAPAPAPAPAAAPAEEMGEELTEPSSPRGRSHARTRSRSRSHQPPPLTSSPSEPGSAPTRYTLPLPSAPPLPTLPRPDTTERDVDL